MTVPAFIVGLSAMMFFGVLPALAQSHDCPSGNPRVAPDSRYIDHGDGTVTDQETGLMWKRCTEGQSGSSCTGNVTRMGWRTALQTAAASSFAGHSDWRLPSAKELLSLVETGCHSPAINTILFPNTPNSVYWTSTTSASNTSSAVGVYFGWGSAGESSKASNSWVRLVRAGQ